mmetsp:Transcript_11041/g.22001  ORF Transcript_11041/g.22001 Transcript_11041/m.22001 type:complete len:391 (+) Transcript_11041:43-1215(+)
MWFASLAASLLVVVSQGQEAGVCSTDDDCNLNGVCNVSSGGTARVCVCAAEWTGDNCGLLNLESARPSPFSGFNEALNSSWGGSIIQDPDDGLYHMFVSRLAGHCGLNAWAHNSEVVRATSNDPEGPFEYAETVLPFFAHGPSVRQMPDGSFMLMHLGCGYPNRAARFVEGCINGTTPDAYNQKKEIEAEEIAVCSQFNVLVLTAPTLLGPWSPNDGSGGTQVSLSRPSWSASGPRGRHFSNPAPHFMANGTILLAYRADDRKGTERVSVGRADSLLDSYVDSRAAPAVDATVEDPFLWQDERGHWHMLMHNMEAIAAHAFSRDAVTWTVSSVEPYDNIVLFTDGSTVSMKRRERPQLLLDKMGRPTYFSTGVMDYDDHSYTLVVKVKKD